MPFDSTSLNLYPTDPGVYLMKDASGRMLYIGKAKNLRNRLKQYFSERKDERPTIVVMMSQLDAIEPIVEQAYLHFCSTVETADNPKRLTFRQTIRL